MGKSKIWTLYNGNTIIMKPETIANAKKIVNFFLDNPKVRGATRSHLEREVGIHRQNLPYVLMALSMREQEPLVRLTTTFIQQNGRWVNIQLVTFIGDRKDLLAKKNKSVEKKKS